MKFMMNAESISPFLNIEFSFEMVRKTFPATLYRHSCDSEEEGEQEV